MQIADLRVENFRGIKTGYVRFGSHTVIVGPNNCGKTTVIEALALLFGRDRMIRALSEHDFFGSSPQPIDRIRLLATIIDFEADDPAENADWFRDDRAVIKWWNPATGFVSATRDGVRGRIHAKLSLRFRPKSMAHHIFQSETELQNVPEAAPSSPSFSVTEKLARYGSSALSGVEPLTLLVTG